MSLCVTLPLASRRRAFRRTGLSLPIPAPGRAFGRLLLAAILLAGIALLAADGAGAATPRQYCEVLKGTDEPDVRPLCIQSHRIAPDLCIAIETYARQHRIPPDFFARLIWQESLFDPGAVSPKGAQGVAQFMPGTARLRGLSDPFNPAEALEKSAEYLAELIRAYGNPGFAAAAYNAGEGRVDDLITRNRAMPGETEDYVSIITGKSIAEWKKGLKSPPDFTLDPGTPFQAACVSLALTRDLKRELGARVAWKPWGVHLGSHFSRSVAQRLFAQLKARYPALLSKETPLIVRDRKLSRGTSVRYALRIGRDSRKGAASLCLRLRAAGANCVIYRN